MAGKRGTKPTPTTILKLHGTYRSDRRSDSEPEPDLCIPDRPKWLTGDARKEWERITPILHQMRCISDADLTMVAAYCFEWGLYVRLCRKLKKISSLTDTTTNGNEILSPLYNVRNAALKNWRSIATEFGLSPSARSRINIEGRGEKEGEFRGMVKRPGRKYAG